MKSLKFLFVTSLFVCFSCDHLSSPDDPSNQNQEIYFKELSRESVGFVFGNFGKFVSKDEFGGVNLDQHRLATANLTNLKNKKVVTGDFDIEVLTRPFKFITLGNFNSRLQTDYGYFNEDQIVLADPFIGNLISATNLIEVSDIASNFNNQVAESNLSESEKTELYLLSSSALAVYDFLENGGIYIIQSQLGMALEPSEGLNTRISGCSVNARSMWISAVYGLTTGAVMGAYAGATAGTVATPVGSVTGAVSGAVIGGATGFVTGAIGSVATQLFETCFR